MILNKSKVEEAAKQYYVDNYCSNDKSDCGGELIRIFIGGTSYAESQLSELFIDFLIWYETSDIKNKKLKYGLPQMGDKFDIYLYSKELFEEFLKYKHEKD